MIRYYNKETNYCLRHKLKISSWITSVVNNHNFTVGSLNFVFTNDEELLNMNIKFLNHNFHTDVITFDTSDYFEQRKPSEISGDIFISIDTVRFNAKYYSQKMSYELCRVIIHGVLHLMGYDDLTSKDKLEMKEQENLALKTVPLNE